MVFISLSFIKGVATIASISKSSSQGVIILVSISKDVREIVVSIYNSPIKLVIKVSIFLKIQWSVLI